MDIISSKKRKSSSEREEDSTYFPFSEEDSTNEVQPWINTGNGTILSKVGCWSKKIIPTPLSSNTLPIPPSSNPPPTPLSTEKNKPPSNPNFPSFFPGYPFFFPEQFNPYSPINNHALFNPKFKEPVDEIIPNQFNSKLNANTGPSVLSTDLNDPGSETTTMNTIHSNPINNNLQSSLSSKSVQNTCSLANCTGSVHTPPHSNSFSASVANPITNTTSSLVNWNASDTNSSINISTNPIPTNSAYDCPGEFIGITDQMKFEPFLFIDGDYLFMIYYKMQNTSFNFDVGSNKVYVKIKINPPASKYTFDFNVAVVPNLGIKEFKFYVDLPMPAYFHETSRIESSNWEGIKIRLNQQNIKFIKL